MIPMTASIRASTAGSFNDLQIDVWLNTYGWRFALFIYLAFQPKAEPVYVALLRNHR
jgi:hypothetical protein